MGGEGGGELWVPVDDRHGEGRRARFRHFATPASGSAHARKGGTMKPPSRICVKRWLICHDSVGTGAYISGGSDP